MPKNNLKKSLSKSLSKEKGFTLIELLISVAIIAILSGISINSFQGATNRAAVKNAAHILKTDLRKWQNFATSGATNPVPGGGGAGCDPTTYDHYKVFASPSVSDGLIHYDYLRYIVRSRSESEYCFEQIDKDLPWNSLVMIVRVGRLGPSVSARDCVSAGVKFQPIGKDVQLICGFIDPETDIVTSLPPGYDRIFFELKHPNDDVRYRVYVTDKGVIYDERVP